MAREPKVMFSARLPGSLVDQIVEAAEEEGLSQGELVERIAGEWLDDRAVEAARSGGRPFDSNEAAHAGLGRIESYLRARGAHWPAQVIVCCKLSEEDGVVIGPADPAELLANAVEFFTIAAAAAGKDLKVVTDGS
jgi:hypothetical protein